MGRASRQSHTSSNGLPASGINLSNSALQPQHSSGVEFGVYQRLDLPGEATFAELTLAAYRQEVRDEIDFDLRTFKYGNILQSRHDGIEASLTARLSPVLSLRNAFTLMQVTFRSGENAGKRLKNIPQVVATSSAHLSPGKSIEGTLTHRFVGGLFLDDPNREWLPGSHSFDAMLSWMVGAVRLQLVGVNVGDSHASTGGFLVYDANRGTNVRLLYPSGGRQLRIGATVLR
jgi:outer membrane receptor protein involved in Fe transport